MKALSIAAIAVMLAGAAQAKGPAPKPMAATPMPPAADQALAHDLLKELIEINSTHAHGSTGVAQAIAKRLLDAGFPSADVQVLAPADHPIKGNTVVRLRGKGLGKPILFILHLDVVEAKPEDWTVDPFKLVEKDGFFYGRGTSDMKGDDAAVLESLIRMKREGFVPDRDIIVAFTADEEAEGDANGVDWLLTAHRDLVDASVVFNPDAGGGGLLHGKRVSYGIQTSEKLYATYALETENRGGHSSVPRPDNAIYQLTHALNRVEAYRFPLRLTATIRGYLKGTADQETGQTRADMLAVTADTPDTAAADRLSERPEFNALLRTTCVTTQMSAGHAENALPAHAKAIVQCRLIPGDTVEETQARLVAAVADPGVKVSLTAPVKPSGETVPDPKIMARFEHVIHGMWPGVPITPSMDAGASDSVHTRALGLPSYGSSAIFGDIDDVRAHGRDERVRQVNFYEGVEFTYRLMKAMSGRE
jgi:acetylornithine deacetylase/succinyl-diaminopimelate desuccinylase-like protein